jgi:hypothetical protein
LSELVEQLELENQQTPKQEGQESERKKVAASNSAECSCCQETLGLLILFKMAERIHSSQLGGAIWQRVNCL